MSGPLLLMYHQIDVPRSAREARFCTLPAEFRRQMQWLQAAGCACAAHSVTMKSSSPSVAKAAASARATAPPHGRSAPVADRIQQRHRMPHARH